MTDSDEEEENATSSREGANPANPLARSAGPQQKTGTLADRRSTLDKRRPPFSAQAAEAWSDRVAEFEYDLGELSMIEAAREGDNYVSDHHVERAAHFLIARSKDRVASIVKDVGGIALGTGAGSLLACASAGIGGLWFGISVVVTILGTGMFFRFSK